MAYNADYIWLAARDRRRCAFPQGHQRCSSCPPTPTGVSIQPFITFGTAHTTATFYDDVRVGDDAVVGELNGGWGLITNQLNHERVSLVRFGADHERMVDEASPLGLARPACADGRRVIDQEWVQIKLAECARLASSIWIS